VDPLSRADDSGWAFAQLTAWGATSPGLAEAALAALRAARPDLWEDLALSAFAEGRLDAAGAAVALEISGGDLIRRVLDWRRRTHLPHHSVVCGLGLGHASRLSESQVPVWEIVRAFRRSGDLDAIAGNFPTVDRLDVITALAYAEDHPAEVEANIDAYDRHRARIAEARSGPPAAGNG